ncbi:carboxylating nicotinate-nucleotide diphosphorylase [Candidatus Manganitrophus noduliformans]|uniref:Probable nicotinate-nucleotide pyrophosphorylase [carboxylating] n=1 Tax=Candidatus Manganitrophus noduliformans TaxID=2606439 RepID=A0A7X6I904_9BACT|nr:carboxylating nicotinate-nucleotide diphosphorylase [Candidatus Manganitrophus noduliformans]NKE69176.1 carboxylating nicotinate-nucleotide diphosphorylase [Candidatus Manganitrophus noduliformans]
MESFLLKKLVERALAEDLSYGDRTTEALFHRPVPAVGEIIAKGDLVVAGLDVFQTVFELLDPTIRVEVNIGPGQKAKPGDSIGSVYGDGRLLLKGERTALNFLQRLSGVATQTRRFVDQVAGTGAKIVDTRKTTPGLRMLEKEAVRLGGGWNHRFHLGDMVLIKDNHIALAGGVANALKEAHVSLSHPFKIEVETTTLAEVKEALQIGAEIILLDNMSLTEIKQSVELIRKGASGVKIEVSGGVRLENVAAIAGCGVDMISVGALTHSAPAVDISFEMKPHSEKK